MGGISMKRYLALVTVLALVVTACGGDDSDDSGGGATNGTVVKVQPPGQAIASVDGLEYSFSSPGGLACAVSDDEFSFSFIIGDNEVVVGGGASISGGQWFGSLTLRIFADNAATEYSAKLIDNPSAIAIDGNSVSYSGPMEKFAPSTDGSLPEPEDVGNGTFSATCG